MIRTILLLSLAIFATSCQPQNETDTTTPNAKQVSLRNTLFPKLLDRAPELRNGKEWDDVQNYYGTQCAALVANPSDHEAQLKLAECFIQEARVTGEHPHYYPAALEMVNHVIADLTPKMATIGIKEKDFLFRALSTQSSVQLSLHDFAAAKETAQKAMTLNPYNAVVVGCMVDANVELGNYEEAVQMCDKMIGIRPDLRSYSRVSYLREIHGDLNGAIDAMQLAIGAGYPGYESTEWARLQLGHLLEKAGRKKEAAVQYQTALEYRPNYPFAMAALAELEVGKGNYNQALKQFKAATEIMPEIGFYISMAKIYQKTGDQSELDKILPQIEQMFAEDMAAGHNMNLEAARFYLELKDDAQKAKQLMEHELQMRPNNRDVAGLVALIDAKFKS